MITISLKLNQLIKTYLHRIITALLICMAMLFPLILAQANKQFESVKNILVIYPESRPAYQSIYDTIIQGMQNNTQTTLTITSFNNTTSSSDIEQLITTTNASAVIALRQAGKLFAQQLNLDIPLITGAHVLCEAGKASVSLAADPFILFTRLKHLKPDVKTVYVVHNKQNTQWLIQDAVITANKLNLNLKVFVADDIKKTSSLVTKVIDQAQENTSAIWLPLDPVLPVKILLPELLRAAWNKNLVIFSNNPVDVRKGVLFAMYPDYEKMGTQLLDLALARISGLKPSRPEPSRHLNSAVNSRTAMHLGIRTDLNKSNFNLIFPE